MSLGEVAAETYQVDLRKSYTLRASPGEEDWSGGQAMAVKNSRLIIPTHRTEKRSIYLENVAGNLRNSQNIAKKALDRSRNCCYR